MTVWPVAAAAVPAPDANAWGAPEEKSLFAIVVIGSRKSA
jgi:hypothetical protein